MRRTIAPTAAIESVSVFAVWRVMVAVVPTVADMARRSTLIAASEPTVATVAVRVRRNTNPRVMVATVAMASVSAFSSDAASSPPCPTLRATVTSTVESLCDRGDRRGDGLRIIFSATASPLRSRCQSGDRQLPGHRATVAMLSAITLHGGIVAAVAMASVSGLFVCLCIVPTVMTAPSRFCGNAGHRTPRAP